MALNGAIVGGAFALGGVALQQAFTVLGERRRAHREEARELRVHRVALYTRMIEDARRVQRTLKDSAVADSDPVTERRLTRELDRLAESVAAVRLLGSESTTRAAEVFEDTARDIYRGPRIERSRHNEGMKLGPLIKALQDDLDHPALDGSGRLVEATGTARR